MQDKKDDETNTGLGFLGVLTLFTAIASLCLSAYIYHQNNKLESWVKENNFDIARIKSDAFYDEMEADADKSFIVVYSVETEDKEKSIEKVQCMPVAYDPVMDKKGFQDLMDRLGEEESKVEILGLVSSKRPCNEEMKYRDEQIS